MNAPTNFKQAKALPERLVVIGNGMAGCRAVEELLARDPARYSITIFGAEPRVNYNRIMLSPVLAGEKSFDEIVLTTAEWYAENGIDLVAGDPVDHIDRAAPGHAVADHDELLGQGRRRLEAGRSVHIRAPFSSAPQVERQRPLTRLSPSSATTASPAKIRNPADELPVYFWAKPSEEAR